MTEMDLRHVRKLNHQQIFLHAIMIHNAKIKKVALICGVNLLASGHAVMELNV
jgi:hypothetical protein